MPKICLILGFLYKWWSNNTFVGRNRFGHLGVWIYNTMITQELVLGLRCLSPFGFHSIFNAVSSPGFEIFTFGLIGSTLGWLPSLQRDFVATVHSDILLWVCCCFCYDNEGGVVVVAAVAILSWINIAVYGIVVSLIIIYVISIVIIFVIKNASSISIVNRIFL